MTDTTSTWPEKITAHTSAEWAEIAKNWTTADRQTVLDALKALKIPAMQYARLSDPKDRVALVMKEQERLLGAGSLSGEKAAGSTEKKAAPKATGTGVASGNSSGGTGGASLAPVLAAIAALQASINETNAILKLLLIQNPDALQLAADADTLNEIASKSLTELAGGNG